MLKVKNVIKILFLSCIISTSAEAYYKPRQTSKTDISVKTAKELYSLSAFEKNSILEVWTVSQYAS